MPTGSLLVAFLFGSFACMLEFGRWQDLQLLYRAKNGNIMDEKALQEGCLQRVACLFRVAIMEVSSRVSGPLESISESSEFFRL